MTTNPKDISRLHYITQDIPALSHVELIEMACASGLRWVQLRLKDKVKEACLDIAQHAKKICDQYGATLIINDHVEIAKAIDAHGVHLGKQDMPVEDARKFLGTDKIIGATANTLQDIIKAEKGGADYIGLGPFRFTSTKKNLEAVIGLSGYEQILSSYQGSIPLIAIGGIQLEDVSAILHTGVHGVAIASAINLADKQQDAIPEFLRATSV